MVLVLAVLLTSAACATGAGSAGGTGASSPLPSEPAASEPGEMDVTGVLVEGLRPTCRVLDAGTRRYALVGPGTQALREGDRVRVVGTPRPELVTPCGLAFAVRALTVM